MTNAAVLPNDNTKSNSPDNANNRNSRDNSLPVLYSFRRCPYAIRARMAIANSKIKVELREILLRDKPRSLLAVSNKGTVPVLVMPDDGVIDESLDIMLWCLTKNDPQGWMGDSMSIRKTTQALIAANDGEFKYFLDRYKYADRFPQRPQSHYRREAERFLKTLESKLVKAPYLCGDAVTLADIAIFPFIRQFSKVDLNWFEQSEYQSLNAWLKAFEQSALFDHIMKKYKPWQEGGPGVEFGDYKSERELFELSESNL